MTRFHIYCYLLLAGLCSFTSTVFGRWQSLVMAIIVGALAVHFEVPERLKMWLTRGKREGNKAEKV